MAPPKTKEEALRQMRLMWFAFLMTIPLYIYVATTTDFDWLNIRNAGTIFDVLGILDLLSFAWIRISRYTPALAVAQGHSEDIRAVKRWMVFWTALLTIADAEALFGVFLQIQNKAVKSAVPFYVVASLLLLTLWPRQIWSQEISATKP